MSSMSGAQNIEFSTYTHMHADKEFKFHWESPDFIVMWIFFIKTFNRYTELASTNCTETGSVVIGK